MRKFTLIPLILIAAFAISGWIVTSPVMAHKGAQGVVKKRMKEMGRMEKQLRLLKMMVQGKAPFNAKAVRERAATLHRHAQRIPALFPAGTHKPPSEASPAIWQHFDDFRQRAAQLDKAAAVLGKATKHTLPDALRQVQAACKGCHERYRIERD